MQKPTLPFSRTNEPGVPDAPLLFAGRYETESRLGIGGMAEVLLARDTALGRRVALKLLAPQLAADPVFVERFRREATAIASLNHPNVIVIYDHGVADGQPFIAMEYVPGRTLKELITAGAPFSAEAAVRYASQVLDGLAAAHAVGIVHRDVKPQNLMVRDDGTLKVADFGVARSADETMLTQYGSVIGTADYISPEQARGAPAGAASDLYSVGVVLFEMLTGRVPFTGEVPLAIANQHVGTPAPPVRELNPAVPVSLARAVERALSKQPSQRYGSAAEMKAALTAPAAEPAPTMVAPTAHVPAAAPTRVMPPPPTEVMPAPTRLAPAPGRRLTRRHGLAALGAAVALAGAVFVLTAGDGDGTQPLVPLPKVVGTPVDTARSALVEGRLRRAGRSEAALRPAGGHRRRRPPHRRIGRARRTDHAHPELGSGTGGRPRGHRVHAGSRDRRTRAPGLRRATDDRLLVRSGGQRDRDDARGRERRGSAQRDLPHDLGRAGACPAREAGASRQGEGQAQGQAGKGPQDSPSRRIDAGRSTPVTCTVCIL